MTGIDWTSLFVPSVKISEIVVRGTVMYLLIFAFLRFLRREAGSLSIPDVLFVVLVADASQNALSGGYTSITEGALLVATIGFWDFVLDWVGYHVPWMRRFVLPAPLPLINNGRLLRRNMRHEMITEDELKGFLREQGVEDINELKKCFLEGDGRISVIKKKN